MQQCFPHGFKWQWFGVRIQIGVIHLSVELCDVGIPSISFLLSFILVIVIVTLIFAFVNKTLAVG